MSRGWMARNWGFVISVVSLVAVVLFYQHCSLHSESYMNGENNQASRSCATDERLMHINGRPTCVRLSCINAQNQVICSEYFMVDPSSATPEQVEEL